MPPALTKARRLAWILAAFAASLGLSGCIVVEHHHHDRPPPPPTVIIH